MPLIDSDPPFFFRRVWQGATAQDEMLVIDRRGNDVQIDMTAKSGDAPADMEVLSIVPPGLVIYGRKVTSSYPEDAEHIEASEAMGLIFTESFSVVCVEGECGTHPLATLTEISRDEFEAARERGWDT